jgi:hypothetical protein
MSLGDFVLKYNKANTEPHADFHGNQLHHCAMVMFAIYSFINSQVEIDIFQT